ncbi:MAG: Zn-ribbon domain-containing OB-fold protein [Chloroflexi bacterium]|nr:Zn-ribbon domain-containing OB-fold protein [Chloroflexota bacterium]
MEQIQKIERPVPVLEPDTAPFWEALARHEFRLFRCKRCGAWYFPVAYCRNHANEPFFGNMEWAIASGRGKVFASLIHYRAFHYAFRKDVPYTYALIEMDEGPMLTSNVVQCDPPQVYIGMPVEVVFEDHRGLSAGKEVSFTLPKFRPTKSQ